MSKIKLISGMDFSGKTTIIKIIEKQMPNVFEIQKKFLTPIDTIEKVRNTWLPAEKWKPLIQNTIKKDINNYKEGKLILQDSLWIIKYLATKMEQNNPEDYEEISQLNELIKQYPNMDSFYLTASLEERINRLNKRIISGEEISGSDKLLFSKEKFGRVENYYKKILLEHFPNTRIIDTTNIMPEEIARNIMEDKNFLKNI